MVMVNTCILRMSQTGVEVLHCTISISHSTIFRWKQGVYFVSRYSLEEDDSCESDSDDRCRCQGSCVSIASSSRHISSISIADQGIHLILGVCCLVFVSSNVPLEFNGIVQCLGCRGIHRGRIAMIWQTIGLDSNVCCGA